MGSLPMMPQMASSQQSAVSWQKRPGGRQQTDSLPPLAGAHAVNKSWQHWSASVQVCCRSRQQVSLAHDWPSGHAVQVPPQPSDWPPH